MLAVGSSNNLSLATSSETFNSLKYSGCTSWEQHFWSYGALQNWVRGLMRRKADWQLQNCQLVISYLWVQRISVHLSQSSIQLWLQTGLLQTLSDLEYLFKHQQYTNFWSYFKSYLECSDSKTVCENDIKYIPSLTANHFYWNAQSTDFLSSKKSLCLFRSEVKMVQWTVLGRNSHGILKAIGDIQE